MIYELKTHNLPAHQDIASAMERRKQGLFTIIIKINRSQIVDLVELEYVTKRP